jgi:glycosidase
MEYYREKIDDDKIFKIGIGQWIRVIYQIFPDRFCNGDLLQRSPHLESWGNNRPQIIFFGGDLKGIQTKLDYLVDWG